MQRGRCVDLYFIKIFILLITISCIKADIGAKDNGDIYVIKISSYNFTVTTEMPTKNATDLEAVTNLCNSSFSIPIDYLEEFNNTGELPDIIDKTGMCFIRCFYEKSGFIDNWALNVELIRQYMWPATGDSISYCQEQGKNEVNACVRTYAIAKCLMIRAIVDARNKPVV
ncbi:general odorant-binding protein 84a [Teleopsis dalmanni]|uniref:general odorant-binding protein 84a n=1 Tax=Teleopsis dalmanni TaxID=139649 RepID=UPI0018CD699C|nr:general odorant-binding protein 84a [Teleopsis dalmanni]